MSRICAVVIFLIAPGLVPAQQIQWTVMEDQGLDLTGLSLPESRKDSVFEKQMTRLLQELQYQGYLSAAYGIQAAPDSGWHVNLYIGPQYKWATLNPGNVPDIILTRSGYRRSDFSEKPFAVREMQKIFDEITEYSEDHGFPFAQVWLDSVRINQEKISGVINYDPGTAIEFDSLRIEGFSGIRPVWLMSYLDIRAGTEFNQHSLDQIPKRIRRLPFVRMAGQPVLTFQNESARVYLPLEQVNANRVDGVVGFLPNEENDGGIRITGQLDLSLTNLFGSGKQLDVAWQRVKPLSQTLGIRYRHPNILRSPVHFDGSFELLKEDTTFINRQFRLALAFTTGIHEIGVFTRLKSTRLLSTEQYENAIELPEFSDQNINYYGLAYDLQSLADGWSDNKGWTIVAQGAVGDKKIRQNGDIPVGLYNGIDLETLQVTGELNITWGFQLGKRSLLFSRFHGGFVSDDQLFLNDLFRIGGLKSLRGFAENNFYVSSFATITVEYQLFFEEYSYLFFFVDQGTLQNSINQTDLYPTGIGLGLTLRTGGGDLQLAYALGRTEDQPLNFSLSKFHFGYIAKF